MWYSCGRLFPHFILTLVQKRDFGALQTERGFKQHVTVTRSTQSSSHRSFLSLFHLTHFPPSYEICHFPSPALTHYLQWHLSGLYTAPSGPAITIAIKRRVIAELRAMSSILQTGPALRLPVLLCWWFYITLSKCLYGWPTDIWSHYIVWWLWPSRVIMPLINRSEWGTRYAH